MADPPELIEYDRWLVRKFGMYADRGPAGYPSGLIPLAWSQVEPSTPFKGNWHLEEISRHCEAVGAGLIKDLIINIPPGTMKSLSTSTFWPAYEWIDDPAKKWIFMSNQPSLSARDAERTMDLVNSAWYQARWPHVKLEGRAVTNYGTSAGGWRLSGSVHGGIVGWHPNIKVIDDPMQPKDAQGNASIQKTELEYVKQWLDGTMAPRGAILNAATVITMQRLHEDDASGYCLAKTSPKFTHLMLPMRYERARRCETPYGGDQRSIEGELLWPAAFGDEKVKELEASLNNEADAQLQQRPARAGGQIFKLAWIKYWTELPREIDEWALSWDMTFKDTMGADFVCGQVWARAGANFYFVDRIYDQMNFPQTLMAFLSQCRSYPQASLKLVEDKANGPAVIATLLGKISGMLAVTPLGSKVGRANGVSHLHRAGNVWYPHPHLPGKAWVLEHVKDMLGFPLRKHDDTVDAETQMLAHWKENGNSLLDALAAQAAQVQAQGIQ